MIRAIRFLLIVALFGMAAYAAYAESVTISTYYPSPYGSYANLVTTGNTYLATTSGSVGVGTETPGAKLHIAAGSLRLDNAQTIQFVDANNTIGINGGAVAIRTGGTDRLNITATGNVGIGNTAPAHRLDVNGNARVQGVLRLQDSGNSPGLLQVDCDGTNCYAVYAP